MTWLDMTADENSSDDMTWYRMTGLQGLTWDNRTDDRWHGIYMYIMTWHNRGLETGYQMHGVSWHGRTANENVAYYVIRWSLFSYTSCHVMSSEYLPILSRHGLHCNNTACYYGHPMTSHLISCCVMSINWYIMHQNCTYVRSYGGI